MKKSQWHKPYRIKKKKSPLSFLKSRVLGLAFLIFIFIAGIFYLFLFFPKANSTNQLVKLIIIVPQKYAPSPEILSPGKSSVKSQRTKILITKLKTPKVRIINGKEKNFSRGFKKTLNRARIRPAIKRSCQSSGKLKFSKKLAAK